MTSEVSDYSDQVRIVREKYGIPEFTRKDESWEVQVSMTQYHQNLYLGILRSALRHHNIPSLWWIQGNIVHHVVSNDDFALLVLLGVAIGRNETKKDDSNGIE